MTRNERGERLAALEAIVDAQRAMSRWGLRMHARAVCRAIDRGIDAGLDLGDIDYALERGAAMAQGRAA